MCFLLLLAIASILTIEGAGQKGAAGATTLGRPPTLAPTGRADNHVVKSPRQIAGLARWREPGRQTPRRVVACRAQTPVSTSPLSLSLATASALYGEPWRAPRDPLPDRDAASARNDMVEGLGRPSRPWPHLRASAALRGDYSPGRAHAYRHVS